MRGLAPRARAEVDDARARFRVEHVADDEGGEVLCACRGGAGQSARACIPDVREIFAEILPCLDIEPAPQHVIERRRYPPRRCRDAHGEAWFHGPLKPSMS